MLELIHPPSPEAGEASALRVVREVSAIDPALFEAEQTILDTLQITKGFNIRTEKMRVNILAVQETRVFFEQLGENLTPELTNELAHYLEENMPDSSREEISDFALTPVERQYMYLRKKWRHMWLVVAGEIHHKTLTNERNTFKRLIEEYFDTTGDAQYLWPSPTDFDSAPTIGGIVLAKFSGRAGEQRSERFMEELVNCTKLDTPVTLDPVTGFKPKSTQNE